MEISGAALINGSATGILVVLVGAIFKYLIARADTLEDKQEKSEEKREALQQRLLETATASAVASEKSLQQRSEESREINDSMAAIVAELHALREAINNDHPPHAER